MSLIRILLVKEDRLKSVSTTLFYFYDILENYLEKKTQQISGCQGPGGEKGVDCKGYRETSEDD